MIGGFHGMVGTGSGEKHDGNRKIKDMCAQIVFRIPSEFVALSR
jgi:hypothetical protein